ncbi:hypothetical protein Bbelb_071140 [Branchiostoma belcheri]|nr:hypothetical protein Bbelb_071140 [Branchiostoma belcheri]
MFGPWFTASARLVAQRGRYVSRIRACAEIYGWRVQARTRPGHLSGSYPGRVQARTRQVYGSRTPGNVRIFEISGRVKPQTCREGYLLFYTEHHCRHIRLCPVRAKLTAPANDAGFRTAETISVHRGGFTLHDDKHSSYSRIQSKSGTKYLVNFAMSTLRCRLQQEFTG